MTSSDQTYTLVKVSFEIVNASCDSVTQRAQERPAIFLNHPTRSRSRRTRNLEHEKIGARLELIGATIIGSKFLTGMNGSLPSEAPRRPPVGKRAGLTLTRREWVKRGPASIGLYAILAIYLDILACRTLYQRCNDRVG